MILPIVHRVKVDPNQNRIAQIIAEREHGWVIDQERMTLDWSKVNHPVHIYNKTKIRTTRLGFPIYDLEPSEWRWEKARSWCNSEHPIRQTNEFDIEDMSYTEVLYDWVDDIAYRGNSVHALLETAYEITVDDYDGWLPSCSERLDESAKIIEEELFLLIDELALCRG